jgi:hypothetical protein
MTHRNPVEAVIFAFHHAGLILPDKLPWWPKDLRPADFDVYCFGQSWPSAACGFPGASAQAMTRADTAVLVSETGHAAVYVAGRFAYAVENPNEEFYDDLRRRHMAGASEAKDYEKKRSY